MKKFVFAWLMLTVCLPVFAQRNFVKGDMNQVRDVVYMPDNKRLAITGISPYIQFYDITDSLYTGRLSVSGNMLNTHIAVNKSGKFLAVGSPSEKIRIVDADNNMVINKIPCREEFSFAFHPVWDELIFTSNEVIKRIGLDKESEAQVLYRKEKSDFSYTRIRISPDGKLVAAADQDANIDLISFPDGKLIYTFNYQSKSISDFGFSPDGKHLAIAVYQNVLFLNLSSFSLETRMFEHIYNLTALQYHPGNKFLFTRAQDQQVRMWSLSEARIIDSVLTGIVSEPNVVISPDGNSLAARSSLNVIRIFDIRASIRKYIDELIAESEKAAAANDWEKSLRYIQSISEHQALDDNLLMIRGKSYYAHGNSELAAKYLQEAIRLNPRCKDCLEFLLKVLKSKGSTDESIEVIHKLLALDPDNKDLRCEELTLLKDKGRFGEINKILANNAMFGMISPACFRDIALACETAGDVKGTAGLYNQYLKKYPNDQDARIRLARCYLKTRDYCRCQNHLDTVLKQHPNDEEAMWMYSLIYFYRRDLKMAKAANDQFLNVYPEKAPAHLLAGVLHQVGRNYLDAATEFDKTLQIDTTDGYASFQLFYSLASINKFHDGFRFLIRILQNQKLKDPEFLNPLSCEDTLKDYLRLRTRFQWEFLDSVRLLTVDLKPKRFETTTEAETRMARNEQMIKNLFDVQQFRFQHRLSEFLRQYSAPASNLSVEETGQYDGITGRLPVVLQKKTYWIRTDEGQAKNIQNNISEYEVKAVRRLRPDLQGYDLDEIKIVNRFTKFTYALEGEPTQSTGAVAVAPPPVNTDIASRGMQEVAKPKPASMAEQVNNYLFIIGINKYLHWNPLKNAVNDAQAIAEVLISRYQFEKERTFALYDEKATWDNIDSVFRLLVKNVKSSDRLLIYYAGHGYNDPLLDKGYLIPVGAHSGKFNEYFGYDRVLTYISSIKSKHTVLFADACYSGSLFQEVSRDGGEKNVNYDDLEDFQSRFGVTSVRLKSTSDAYGNTGHSGFCYFLLEFLTNNKRPSVFMNQLTTELTERLKANNFDSPIALPLKATGHSTGQFVFHLKNP